MQLEFRLGGTLIRVDGEIVEIFGGVEFSHRYLLPSLRMEVQPSRKGELVMRSTSAPADWPLDELGGAAVRLLCGGLTRFQSGQVYLQRLGVTRRLTG